MSKIKQKTNSSAKKRFPKTANGFKRAKANKSHILTKKATKRKRGLRQRVAVHKSDENRVARMLNYA